MIMIGVPIKNRPQINLTENEAIESINPKPIQAVAIPNIIVIILNKTFPFLLILVSSILVIIYILYHINISSAKDSSAVIPTASNNRQ